jgi:malonate transporter and related proteins
MLDVINLALPFFGLIFLGYGFGKLSSLPEDGLAWMNFFIIYVALPALFYRIVAQTPLEQLANPRYVVGTTLATFLAFALSFAIGLILLRGHLAPATIAGLAGGYGNIGYMGPGLALATLGPEAAAPVALIFCFDTLLLFSLIPMLMAAADPHGAGLGASIIAVLRQIVLNPLVIATALGVASAAAEFQLPVALDRLMAFLQNAAAPCALFTLGVTVALRPLQRVPWEVPINVAVKLLVHPVIALALMALLGPFADTWMSTAVLMAALPSALNVFVIARQFETWIEQASGAVLLGTLVSVVTLTTVMWLVKTHQLPVLIFR